MNTPESQRRYELYLLDELTREEAAQLQSQLETDASSQAELETARKLLAALDAGLAMPEDAEGLADRIVGELYAVDNRRARSDTRVSARRRFDWQWIAPLAVGACLLLALAAWRFWPAQPRPNEMAGDPQPNVPQRNDGNRPGSSIAQLGRWRITPTGEAKFRVIEPALDRLEHGELLLESTSGETNSEAAAGEDVGSRSLRIETPQGEAIATGTKFYIGAHQFKESEGSAMLKSLTRVLVLSGAVTLTTALGSVEGTTGELLAAEQNQAPTKMAVQANSEFAVDLYRQLAKENKGENLFFSPYSVSVALAMTAEGARGETAEEMGNVLRFPGGIRRMGDDAQRIPWETSQIHTAMAALQSKLNRTDEEKQAHAKAIRAKIAAQQAELAKLGITLKQMSEPFFDVNRSFEDVQKAEKIAARIRALSSQIDQYEIRVANALWGEKTYPFRKEFIDTVGKHYETGGIFPMDFRNHHEAERKKINRWVEEQTNDRIKDLLPKGALSPAASLVLTNAIYFKGQWSVPFDEKNTAQEPFTLANGRKVAAPIMYAPDLEVARYSAFNKDGTFFATPKEIRIDQTTGLYPDAGGFAMVELPYKGDDISMVVIAPMQADGLAAMESKLTAENLNQWISKLEHRDTHVHLPKFKMETKYTLGDSDQPRALQAMGMNRAFVEPRNANGADFSGMSSSNNPLEQLYVSKVLHKAFIEVNEKGTEAAAATVVGMLDGGIPKFVPFTPEFKADRPFLFLIREKSTGSILFLGRMTNPVEQ